MQQYLKTLWGGKNTTINQTSQKASINWQNFSIASNETVNFNQPNQNSITLNRVVGNEKSIIDGALNANGQVWLINANGTIFNKNSKVNTAGLLVTTKNLSDEDFQAGNYNFKGDSKAEIKNFGEINLNDKAYALFVANSVVNSGEIIIHKGTIHLASADEFTVSLADNSNVKLKVTKGTLDALVENNNLLVANGGNVYLTTNAKNELLKGVVNNIGRIEANSLDDITGNQSEVIIYAHGGTANIDGEIKAKNSFVETSGKHLNITNESTIKAGKWLIDPENVTIDNSNGSIGAESVGASVVENALSSGDVTIQADNNITVNENITWSEETQLKLQADNINVNATINNTNSTNGGVYFEAANTTNKVVFGDTGKVVINNAHQLQWMNTALNGKYELGSNIDASATNGWNSNGSGGYYGFNPVGNGTNKFNGTFDGLGNTISNLYINRPTQYSVGLFGSTNTNAIVKNITLENINVNGNYYVGGLVGWNADGTIQNSYATGTAKGDEYVGGLLGYNNNGTIENSYASGTVNGYSSVGGLLGYNYIGTIQNSYYDSLKNSTLNGVGNETNNTGVQGKTTQELNYGGTFKLWDIVADSSVISLTPIIKWDSVNNKYVWAIAPIALSYNLGSKSTTYKGTTQSLSSFYSTSEIFGNEYDFLNLAYKFQKDGSDVTEYKNAGTYSNIKVVLDGTSASDEFLTIASSGNIDGTLTINKANLVATLNNDSKTYDGVSYKGGKGATYSGFVNNENESELGGSLSYNGNSQGATAVGTYEINGSGLSAQNYNITYVAGELKINSAPDVEPKPEPEQKIDENIQKVIASIEPHIVDNNPTVNNISENSIANSNFDNTTSNSTNNNNETGLDFNNNVQTFSLANVNNNKIINGGVNTPTNIATNLADLSATQGDNSDEDK